MEELKQREEVKEGARGVKQSAVRERRRDINCLLTRTVLSREWNTV